MSNSMMYAPRAKRDVPRRRYLVELVLYKRRFWCIRCRKAFTESDRACGRYKRTPVRLREEIGQQASTRPIAHVASPYEVGPRFVRWRARELHPKSLVAFHSFVNRLDLHFSGASGLVSQAEKPVFSLIDGEPFRHKHIVRAARYVPQQYQPWHCVHRRSRKLSWQDRYNRRHDDQ